MHQIQIQQQNVRNVNSNPPQHHQQQTMNKNFIMQQMQKSPISQLAQYQMSFQNMPFQVSINFAPF